MKPERVVFSKEAKLLQGLEDMEGSYFGAARAQEREQKDGTFQKYHYPKLPDADPLPALKTLHAELWGLLDYMAASNKERAALANECYLNVRDENREGFDINWRQTQKTPQKTYESRERILGQTYAALSWNPEYAEIIEGLAVRAGVDLGLREKEDGTKTQVERPYNQIIASARNVIVASNDRDGKAASYNGVNF